jgi:hypothetical protein
MRTLHSWLGSQLGWSLSTSPCGDVGGWSGCECTDDLQHIARINLGGRLLFAVVDADAGGDSTAPAAAALLPAAVLLDLPALRELRLVGCGLQGPLPELVAASPSPSMSSMLEVLDVSEGEMTGAIPTGYLNLASLPRLRELHLAGNRFDGDASTATAPQPGSTLVIDAACNFFAPTTPTTTTTAATITPCAWCQAGAVPAVAVAPADATDQCRWLHSPSLQADMRVLLQWRPAARALNWTVAVSACEWAGVTCDENQEHVVELDLSGRFSLDGEHNNDSDGDDGYGGSGSSRELPLAIVTELPRLKSLRLVAIGLRGVLPVLHHSPIEILDLSENWLVDNIPVHYAQVGETHLRELHLRANTLSGRAPMFPPSMVVDASCNELVLADAGGGYSGNGNAAKYPPDLCDECPDGAMITFGTNQCYWPVAPTLEADIRTLLQWRAVATALGWNSTTSPCRWRGVKCDTDLDLSGKASVAVVAGGSASASAASEKRAEYIAEIDVSGLLTLGASVDGDHGGGGDFSDGSGMPRADGLPGDIVNMPGLHRLLAVGIGLGGMLPPIRSSPLHELDLSENFLVDQIPMSYTTHSNLQKLRLRGNLLEGPGLPPFPPEMQIDVSCNFLQQGEGTAQQGARLFLEPPGPCDECAVDVPGAVADTTGGTNQCRYPAAPSLMRDMRLLLEVWPTVAAELGWSLERSACRSDGDGSGDGSSGWAGIECDELEQFVTRLKLTGLCFNLGVTLPAAIVQRLPALVELQLQGVGLVGLLPGLGDEVACCETINVQDNRLIGQVPQSYSPPTSLRTFLARNNLLSGETPDFDLVMIVGSDGGGGNGDGPPAMTVDLACNFLSPRAGTAARNTAMHGRACGQGQCTAADEHAVAVGGGGGVGADDVDVSNQCACARGWQLGTGPEIEDPADATMCHCDSDGGEPATPTPLTSESSSSPSSSVIDSSSASSPTPTPTPSTESHSHSNDDRFGITHLMLFTIGGLVVGVVSAACYYRRRRGSVGGDSRSHALLGEIEIDAMGGRGWS